MEQDYVLWYISNGFTQKVGTYNTYEDAFEVAKKLNDKYNDEGNYWDEKDQFYIAEEGMRPTQVKKLLNSNHYLRFYPWERAWRDRLKDEQEKRMEKRKV